MWISLGKTTITCVRLNRHTDDAPPNQPVRRVDGKLIVTFEQPRSASGQNVDRQILRLAIPALGALLAEPLFILADTAIVGRLGTSSLAALSVASTVLLTVVGLCVFLAYATTASVARLIGAGQQSRAIRAGIDGMWLAVGLGVVLTVVLVLFGHDVLVLLGASGEVASLANDYLRLSACGLPGMLVVLAATGVMRGMQDTRTPLIISVAGASANVIANWLLVYGFNLGIAGSGLGTAICQSGMGIAAGWIVARGARRYGVSLRPHSSGVLSQVRSGIPLLIRTLSLRIAILLTVVAATRLGDVTLAGHQIVTAIWNFIAYGLDALAIAAQALVGKYLGAGDHGATRALLHRTLRWGVVTGLVCGLVVAASSWWFTPLFTSDPQVRSAATVTLIVVSVLMPMAGWVFVLDGVLIGAGDGRYLAWVGIVTLLVYLPALWAVAEFADVGSAALMWLWVAFGGWFMAARAITTGWRARGTRWMVLGAA